METQTQQSASEAQGSTEAGGAAEQQVENQDANFLSDDGSTGTGNAEGKAPEAGQEDSDKNFMSDGSDDDASGETGSKDDAESSEKETEDGTTEGAPEEYGEFKMPEGMTEDKELTAKVAPLFKEMNLSQEQAQKLVDAYAPHVQQVAASAVENHIAQIEDMVKAENQKNYESLMAMPNRDEIKGNVNNALKFLAQTPEEAAYLRADGNNPLLVNMLSRLGQQIGEGKFVEGSPGSREMTSEEKLNEMYPSMSNKG